MKAKFVIRGRVRELDGMTATQAFPFFREKLGAPDDIDGVVGVDDYFYFRYEAAKHDGWAVVATEASFRPGLWGVDYVLLEGYETRDPWPGSVAMPDLVSIVQAMQSRFGIEARDIRVTAYTWYTGVDEPIDLKDGAAVSVKST